MDVIRNSLLHAALCFMAPELLGCVHRGNEANTHARVSAPAQQTTSTSVKPPVTRQTASASSPPPGPTSDRG